MHGERRASGRVYGARRDRLVPLVRLRSEPDEADEAREQYQRDYDQRYL